MSDALDLDPNDITDLEPRLSRAKCRHAAGRAGRDDIAGLEGEYRRKLLDQGGTIEDQVARVGGLTDFSVHKGLDVEGDRIWQFIGRDDHGPHRAMGVDRKS